MPVTGSIVGYPIKHYGRQRMLLSASFDVGATGAVGNIVGEGFGTTAVEGRQGSIVRDSAGTYTVTMPGRGSVRDIIPLSIGAETDEDVFVKVEDIDLANRSVTFIFREADGTPADEELTSGDRVFFCFLVDNSVG